MTERKEPSTESPFPFPEREVFRFSHRSDGRAERTISDEQCGPFLEEETELASPIGSGDDEERGLLKA
jgi:hypothetical protein